MSLAEGGASFAVGGAALGGAARGGAAALGGAALATACLAALASVALGGGAAASVPARSASALYWAWAPAAVTCWVVLAWAAVFGAAGRVGIAARSGVVVAASAAACWVLSVGNWVSGAGESSPIRPVGSRSAMVWQPDMPTASVSASVAIVKGRAEILIMPKLPLFQHCPASPNLTVSRSRAATRGANLPFRYTATKAPAPAKEQVNVANDCDISRGSPAFAAACGGWRDRAITDFTKGPRCPPKIQPPLPPRPNRRPRLRRSTPANSRATC